MAYTSTALLALMVIAAASAVHCARIPDDENTAQIRITGVVECKVDGNTLGKDITTVKVSLSCKEGGTTKNLGQAKPKPDGFVNIVLNAANSAIFRNSLMCVVTAEFPVAKCNVLQPDGLVSSVLFPLLGNLGPYNFRILGLGLGI